ncbi:hypothetical protein [Vibrio rumoiensis]|uniref:Uncharacterized protein n=1 Tax=Vibrio rumoiensis 1S-45 TaxID=1188252 RepID=A0A1E5E3E8_9VIBR|nr:hypothetical protein [Vibrio rumoiensis]OEF26310.1 hypothetical protein A1QC_07075 [Vibrio rumoiensis 1S-45]
MASPLKIGKETVLDAHSVEYEWIRNLASDGNSREQINHLIQYCLGGDDQIADTMRLVATKQASMYDLMRIIS